MKKSDEERLKKIVSTWESLSRQLEELGLEDHAVQQNLLCATKVQQTARK